MLQRSAEYRMIVPVTPEISRRPGEWKGRVCRCSYRRGLLRFRKAQRKLGNSVRVRRESPRSTDRAAHECIETFVEPASFGRDAPCFSAAGPPKQHPVTKGPALIG